MLSQSVNLYTNVQITTAVFDRMIGKFKDVLLNEELDAERTRDALKTLNEQVHHQVSRLELSLIVLLTSIVSLAGNGGHDDQPRDSANWS